MQACYYAESHQSQYVFVYIIYHIDRPSPKEDIMEIVVIGVGATQFLRAITFEYTALVDESESFFIRNRYQTNFLQ